MLTCYVIESDLVASLLVQVRQAFSERRKMIRNTLQSVYEPSLVNSALEATGVADTARPQQLSLGQYVQLWRQLNANALSS